MSLVTRCPSCATAFRVLPRELSARSGQVRCGRCYAVFDGIAGLVADARAPMPDQAALEDGAQPLADFLAEPPRPRRVLWWTLIVLAGLALGAQLAHHYRAELAAGLPGVRRPLEEACRLLDCEVRLPRQIKLLSIDSYEVTPDPGREGVIVLNAVIRNRAPFAQEYPALQFTLTDERHRELVSRSLLPREYLEPAHAGDLMARGIAPGGEATLSVYFDASRTRATGYELVLFYPS